MPADTDQISILHFISDSLKAIVMMRDSSILGDVGYAVGDAVAQVFPWFIYFSFCVPFIVLIEGLLIQPLLGIKSKLFAIIFSFGLNYLSFSIASTILSSLHIERFWFLGPIEVSPYLLIVLIEWCLLLLYLIFLDRQVTFFKCLRASVIMNAYSYSLIILPLLVVTYVFNKRVFVVN